MGRSRGAVCVYMALRNVTGCTKMSGFMLDCNAPNARGAPGRPDDKTPNTSIRLFILVPRPEL